MYQFTFIMDQDYVKLFGGRGLSNDTRRKFISFSFLSIRFDVFT